MYSVDEYRIIKGDPIINNSALYLTTASRGCPFKCSYCVNSILRDIYPGNSKFTRKRDPDNVVKEIEHALNTLPNIHKIRFEDEVFPWEESWLEGFHEAYKSRISLPFLCTYHPVMVNEQRISILKAAGMGTMGLGIQSPSEKIRKQIFNRPESNEQLLKVINILHKYKIEVNFDLILDNPYETQIEKRVGLEFLLSLPKPFTLSVFPLKFLPKVKLTAKALVDHIVSDTQIEKGDGSFSFQYDWNEKKKRGDIFWNGLFVLASRSCIPRSLVHHFKQSSFIKKNPGIILSIMRVSKYPEFIIIGLRRFFHRQINLSALRSLLKLRVLKFIFSRLT
ncbi:MAG: B12-binding domain-containing radical SAM protein [Candidatus Hodarchaeota archaeon]